MGNPPGRVRGNDAEDKLFTLSAGAFRVTAALGGTRP